MPHRAALPPDLGTGSFSTRRALAQGVTPWRLRAADIEHPFHGVNVVVPAEEHEVDDRIEQLCEVYLRRMLPGQFFSHQTAALLFGVPLPRSALTAALHIGVHTPRTPPRARNVIGHRVPAHAVVGTWRGRFAACSPADVFCQLSAVLDRTDLVAAGDFLLGARKRAALTSLDELRAAAQRYSGRRGAPDRAWALERLRPGADSRPESLLRLLLVDVGLPEPLVNPPVQVDGGRLILHPDLLLEEARVVFEYEGDDHRTQRTQWLDDIDRRELFEAERYRVMRVTSRHVFGRREAFVQRLRRAGLLRGAKSATNAV